MRWRSVQLDGRLKNILLSPGLAVVAAFVLRMFLFWLIHRGGDIDTPRFRTVGIEIESVARSIAGGLGFSKIMYIFEGPTAWVAPVYPYLMAPISRLTHLNTAATLAGCQILNSVFAAMTCWPIYALGRRIFTPGLGLASAWLWVLLPTAVQMPLEWTWDQSLSALLLPLLLCATYAIRDSTSNVRWMGYGLFWAFAALTNPALCVMLPFLAGWLMLERRKSALPTVPLVARAMLFFVLGLLPWTVRNYWAMDGFVPVKSNFGLELWLGNNPAVQHIYTPQLHPWVDSNQAVALAMSGEINYNRKAGRSALQFIETHPSRFLELLLERIGDTWTDKYDVQTDPWLMELHLEKAYVIYFSGFSLFGLAGLLVGSYQYRAEVGPLALAVLLFPVIYYVTHSAARYRHPIDPVMCILSVFVVEQAVWLLSLKLRSHEETVTASLEPRAAVSSRN